MRVIERTQADIDKETEDLYQQCKPYLDEGYTLHNAVKKVKGIKESSNVNNQAWYKRYRDYALEHGYERKR